MYKRAEDMNNNNNSSTEKPENTANTAKNKSLWKKIKNGLKEVKFIVKFFSAIFALIILFYEIKEAKNNDISTHPENNEQPTGYESATKTDTPIADNNIIIQSATLDSLQPINSTDWKWNYGSPVAPDGNEYDTGENYVIIDELSDDSIKYRVDKQYRTLMFTAAPSKYIADNEYCTVKVYVDDKSEPVYTSPEIGRESNPKPCSAPINGAEFVTIKIECSLSSYTGDLIIMNCMLNP